MNKDSILYTEVIKHRCTHTHTQIHRFTHIIVHTSAQVMTWKRCALASKPGELKCIVRFILTPFNCELISHFHLFAKSPPRCHLPLNFLLTNPYKILSSFIYRLFHSPSTFTFAIISFLSLGLFTIIFVQVIHSHPVISLQNLLSVSCPLPFLFFFFVLSIILKSLPLLFRHSFLSPIRLFHSLCASLLTSSCFSSIFFQFLSSLHIPTLSDLFASLLSVMLAILPHLSSFFHYILSPVPSTCLPFITWAEY